MALQFIRCRDYYVACDKAGNEIIVRATRAGVRVEELDRDGRLVETYVFNSGATAKEFCNVAWG